MTTLYTVTTFFGEAVLNLQFNFSPMKLRKTKLKMAERQLNFFKNPSTMNSINPFVHRKGGHTGKKNCVLRGRHSPPFPMKFSCHFFKF